MDVVWTLRRLKAMSKEEVLWRISQKRIERTERSTFAKNKIPVTETIFYEDVEGLSFHGSRLPLDEYMSAFCENVPPRRSIDLPGSFNYDTHMKNWHAGFQTENRWPLIFAYDLTYKQRDDIGDARTNWELNRHFQFALLAKAYYDTHDDRYLNELIELFDDWNVENPFLWGISWTGVMEVAIRSINWMFTLGFLLKSVIDDRKLSEKQKELFNALAVGIINMTSYISAHFSRYSSANNHVIVEMAAIGIAGLCFDYEPWRDLAVTVLNEEIPRQNYHDGVNKEMSLHYQAFFMEAVGLLMMTLRKNGRNIPMNWKYVLRAMTGYLADCRGYFGETIVFGDDDGGKILDLFHPEGREDYYRYVFQMMDMVLPGSTPKSLMFKCVKADANHSDLSDHDSKKEVLGEIQPKTKSSDAVCYPEGGVTLMHSHDHRAFLAIDHGSLGFGSIAAHGHADALSFQFYLDGEPVFVDPGTYIYHTDRKNRDYFRSTAVHNTITIDGKDQSEMLGPFLWGKRAETELKTFDSEKMVLEAFHDGYAPIIHTRQFELQDKKLIITDTLSSIAEDKVINCLLNFTLGEDMIVQGEDNLILRTRSGNMVRILVNVGIESGNQLQPSIDDGFYSPLYGELRHTRQIHFEESLNKSETFITEIAWEQDACTIDE